MAESPWAPTRTPRTPDRQTLAHFSDHSASLARWAARSIPPGFRESPPRYKGSGHAATTLSIHTKRDTDPKDSLLEYPTARPRKPGVRPPPDPRAATFQPDTARPARFVQTISSRTLYQPTAVPALQSINYSFFCPSARYYGQHFRAPPP